MRFVQQRLDYAEETDAVIGLRKARECRAALRQLLLRRPTDLQQGGVGRGSGFSMSFEPGSIQTLIEEISLYIATSSGATEGYFGEFGADMRNLMTPFASDC
jgi:hypothetical protein